MNIIKRDGSQAIFDTSKIAAAIRKANATVEDADKLTEARIERIAAQIEAFAESHDRALGVEEIQDIVETKIQEAGAHMVAKKYIKYRFVQDIKRRHNTTDGEVLTLINCTNEEAKQENANKNPVVNSTQRDYMAGAVSKDITKRLLLPEEVTVISGTKIDRPHSFSTACNIATQIIAQVASNQYGGQSISLTHLAPFVQVSREKIAQEVESEIAFAGVDAHYQEPIPDDYPLKTLDNVILTPHIAGVTGDSFRAMMHGAFSNIEKFEQGRLDEIAHCRYI